jgi:hypothetical protein
MLLIVFTRCLQVEAFPIIFALNDFNDSTADVEKLRVKVGGSL